MNQYTTLSKCLCCDSSILEQVINLGDHPLANSFTEQQVEHTRYPLVIMHCPDCTHYQLSISVDPDILFKDYCYVSGTTQTLKNYFSFFAYWSTEQYKNWNEFTRSPRTVLDIACNDGSLLDQYKDIDIWTYGIDPAENLHKESSKKHHIICDYLQDDSYNGEHFDMITAQNVLAHTPEPLKFLKNCKRLLAKKGLLFIQTSQANTIKRAEPDYWYHEHVSQFTYMSMNRLVKRVGLQIVGHHYFSIHGTSQVFVLAHIGENRKHKYIGDNDYRKRVEGLKENLLKELQQKRDEGYIIIGYGAAAKGMTLLGYLDLKLDYIVDDNPMKAGKVAPVHNIPVVSREIFSEKKFDKIAFLPLAWNFFDEIYKRVKEVRDNKNDVFIKYFPAIEIIQ